MQLQPATEVLSRIAERDAVRRDRLADSVSERDASGEEAAQAAKQIEDRLMAVDIRLRLSEGEGANLTATDTHQIASELDSLEQFFTGHTWLLPAYTVRRTEGDLTALRQRLAEAAASQKPKKKFGFSSRVKTVSVASAPAQPAALDQLTAAQPDDPQPAAREQTADAAPAVHPDRELRGLRGKKIVKRQDSLRGKDFGVADCQDCTILLLGRISALRLRNVRSCCIVAGQVEGATFVEGARDSTIILASQQVRIHESTASLVFLQVGTNPIIEHCSDMAFGALTVPQRQLLGLPPVADPWCVNKWDAVQDFNWLRATQSPNWRLMTSEEMTSAGCPSADDSVDAAMFTAEDEL